MWAAGHTSDTPSNDAIKTIELLLLNGAKVDYKDDKNMTALSYAKKLNNKKAYDFLIKNGVLN